MDEQSQHRTTFMRMLLVLILMTVLPSLALAQSNAELRYQEAVRLFGEGRYRESLHAFNEAIELDPQSVFYCNRALVELKLQETAQAAASFRACRDSFEGDEAELASIEAQLKGVEMYEFHLRPRSITVARDIAAGPVQLQQPVEVSTGWDVGDTGFVFLGASAALFASALTLDLLSADLKEDFQTQSQGGMGTSEARYTELKTELETRQTVFFTLGALGAGAALVGGGLLIYHYANHPEPVVLPYFGPEEFGISGRF